MPSKKRKTDQANKALTKELEKKYGKEIAENPHFQSFVAALIKNQIQV